MCRQTLQVVEGFEMFAMNLSFLGLDAKDLHPYLT